MGHLLTVPSAPNWRSINTGKWESCRSKEQRRLRRCSANVKLLHVSVLMAQRRFFFLSLTGWWDRNQGENNQFLVLSLSAYYFKAHCLTTWWKGCFFFAECAQYIDGWIPHKFVIDQASVVQRVNLCLAFGCSAPASDKDQKPNISLLTAPKGPWEL